MKKDSSHSREDGTHTQHDVALYRKYRPQKFSDVIGQDHIVSVLQNSVKQNNISHAYLFAGSRGTGKTSVARIFSREIGTSANDLYEIDAASNRGIDDIREIRESVNTLPFESQYKVYIVDEVHMLTKEAFNALLKTLEEPPAHVVFILATTEMEKLPETVVSRCQAFVFKKPGQQMLKKAVSDIAQQEGFEIDASSADLVAILGDSSFRDTIGVLQKVLSSVSAEKGAGDKKSDEKKITLDMVELVTGAPRGEIINGIIEGVSRKDMQKAMLSVQQAVEQNLDMNVCMKLVLEKLRFLLLLRIAPTMASYVEKQVSDDDFTWLKTLASDTGVHISSAVLLEMLSAYEHVGKAYISHLPLELAIVNVCSVE